MAADHDIRIANGCDSGHSLDRLVLPPPGLKLLDDLAWKIGRDDCARGFLPLRALNYRPDKAKHYMDGYEAQMRQNTERSGSAT